VVLHAEILRFRLDVRPLRFEELEEGGGAGFVRVFGYSQLILSALEHSAPLVDVEERHGPLPSADGVGDLVPDSVEEPGDVGGRAGKVGATAGSGSSDGDCIPQRFATCWRARSSSISPSTTAFAYLSPSSSILRSSCCEMSPAAARNREIRIVSS